MSKPTQLAGLSECDLVIVTFELYKALLADIATPKLLHNIRGGVFNDPCTYTCMGGGCPRGKTNEIKMVA